MTTETCSHHWLIEPADGPTSNGSCQRCGETKEFTNSLIAPLTKDGSDKQIKETTEVIEGRKKHRRDNQIVAYGLEG